MIKAKRLKEQDIENIYNICKNNKTYYKYYKQEPTFENIKEIFIALPPKVTMKDKYFLGIYENNKLIGILDLITNFPAKNSVYIGLFMLDINLQNKGIGSVIINKLCIFLKKRKFNNIELAYIEDNVQARNFWLKNNFLFKGNVTKLENFNVVSMYKML